MAHLLHHLLERSAAARPDAVAVVDGERSWTYAQLDRRANQIANLLVARGVRRGDRVALYIEKSAEAVAGIYGVLKAGAAYVPLDPAAPAARLGYIAGNAGARVLLTGVGKSSSWQALLDAGASPEAVVALD